MAEGIAGANSFQSFYTMEDQVTRASNYLKYSSPLIGGGFTFGAGWAPGEDPTAGNKGNRNYLDMHVRWEQGPFGIGLAHARFKSNSTGAAVAAVVAGVPGTFPVAAQAIGQDFNEKDTSLAAYYKFSGWRLYGVHSRSTQGGSGLAAIAATTNFGERFRLNGARVEMDIGKGILAFSVAADRKSVV